jgi:type I restriction enzyme R subunit
MNAALPLQFFDRNADPQIVERRLPHWLQAGTVCFITWRTVDSLPQPVLDQWFRARTEWLRAHQIDPEQPDWHEELKHLGPPVCREFFDTFWNRWHDSLEAGHGACLLRDPTLADIVAGSLRHFDDQRYRLFDYVVMPNHVHLLAAFADEGAMLKQCESWKHLTATQINRRSNARGRFWQPDAFDHLIRSEEQFQYLRRYVADNPARIGLKSNECAHYSKQLA